MASPDAKVFWLGTRGQMVPLVAPTEAVNRTESKIGSSQESLNGTVTESVRGLRRSWSIDQAYLKPEDLSVLQALFSGVVLGNTYIIDPVSPNRFPRSTAVGAKLYQWAGGTYDWFEPDSPYVAVSEVGTAPGVTYTSVGGNTVTWNPSHFIRWNPTSSSASLYAGADYRLALRRETPVIPGESLVFKGHVRGSASVCLEYVGPSGAGIEDSPAGVVESDVWEQFTVNTVVPDNAVAVRVRADASSTDPVDFCQFQLGPDDSPWTQGGGSALVLISALEEESPQFPLVSVSLTIQEI